MPDKDQVDGDEKQSRERKIKKPYSSPKVIVHGTVSSLTRGGPAGSTEAPSTDLISVS